MENENKALKAEITELMNELAMFEAWRARIEKRWIDAIHVCGVILNPKSAAEYDAISDIVNDAHDFVIAMKEKPGIPPQSLDDKIAIYKLVEARKEKFTTNPSPAPRPICKNIGDRRGRQWCEVGLKIKNKYKFFGGYVHWGLPDSTCLECPKYEPAPAPKEEK
jgi:hypothetical protein